MADRRTYYQGQLVQEDELNAGFTGLENADRNAMVDLALAGVASGLTVAEASPTSLSVQVGGPGVAYDPNGQRCAVPGTQLVDLSVDSLGASTAVTLSGNKKIVSLFIKFARANSDTRPTDETPPQMVNFVNNESFAFAIVQSAEAATPAVPALLSDGILLADVTLSFGQTQILNADISTARRQGLMALSGTPHAINVGSIKATLQALLGILNAHIDASADKHPAADIVVGTITATESLQPDLTTAANLMLALQHLRVATNIWASPDASWIGGNGFVQGNNIDAVLVEIVQSIGLATNINIDGASRIGAAARGTLIAGSVGTQLSAIETAKASKAANNIYTGDNTFNKYPKLTAPAITRTFRPRVVGLHNATVSLGSPNAYVDNVCYPVVSFTNASGYITLEFPNIPVDSVITGIAFKLYTTTVTGGSYDVAYETITGTRAHPVSAVAIPAASGGVVTVNTTGLSLTVVSDRVYVLVLGLSGPGLADVTVGAVVVTYQPATIYG